MSGFLVAINNSFRCSRRAPVNQRSNQEKEAQRADQPASQVGKSLLAGWLAREARCSWKQNLPGYYSKRVANRSGRVCRLRIGLSGKVLRAGERGKGQVPIRRLAKKLLPREPPIQSKQDKLY